MTEPSVAPLVAIIDTQEEVVQLLSWTLEDAGYRTVAAYVRDLRRGEPEPADFLAQHDPQVILWDIAIPYEENWRFFESVVNRLPDRKHCFVLTTTNKRRLEELVGPTETIEIVGRPFDLEAIVQAVREALECSETN